MSPGLVLSADEILDFFIAMSNILPNNPNAVFAELVPVSDLVAMAEEDILNAEWEFTSKIVPALFETFADWGDPTHVDSPPSPAPSATLRRSRTIRRTRLTISGRRISEGRCAPSAGIGEPPGLRVIIKPDAHAVAHE